MRIPLRKELSAPASSFMALELIEAHFDPNWHFHPHYQIFTVLEGSGTRFIGDDIRHFEAGDTVFWGLMCLIFGVATERILRETPI